MDWLIRGDVALLSLMLVNTADIVCHRFYRYREPASNPMLLFATPHPHCEKEISEKSPRSPNAIASATLRA
jgi:hypothetical protein